MRTIDSHQHFWTLSRGDNDWITERHAPIRRDFGPEELRPQLDAAGMDGSIIVQAASTVAETEFMLAIADAHDWIFGVVGWVNMAAKDAPDTLARLAENPKLVGIRSGIEGLPDSSWILGDDLSPTFNALVELNLTFDCQGKYYDLPVQHQVIDKYPDLKCVVDHGSKPNIRGREFQPWADQITDIAQNTNACCKLSALTSEAAADWSEADIRPYAKHILESFGPSRVMYGSDWPVVRMQSAYADWKAMVDMWIADLSDEDKAQVLGGTAERFYLQR